MGTKVYFFSGPFFERFDRANDRADPGYPLPTSGSWPGMAAAGFASGFDTVVNLGKGKLYFFKSDQYLRYDIATDTVEPGYPLPIRGNWPGFEAAGFESGIDAALSLGNGKAYFFKGSNYLRYDINLDSVDPGYPLPIRGNWPGLAESGFDSDLDAAIEYRNGKAFFFKGSQYVRYDIAEDRVDAGYPLPISGQWPSLSLVSGLSGVADVFIPDAELWVPSAKIARAPVTGPKFLPLPWRGVLHTTEGTTAAGAINSFKSTNFWPHFTVEPTTGISFQHLSLNIGARALSDRMAPANASHAIQIEIVGLAATTPSWTPESLRVIRDLVREIDELVPIPRASNRIFLDDKGVNATPGNRMSVSEWQRFSGWCGHQHVPGENHWDPGAIDIREILS